MTTITTETDRKTRIFVYGTLKQGFPNHHLLETHISSNDVVFMGLYKTLNPYPLVLGPLGVPILINRPGSGFRVTGELYSVSSQVLPPLDDLEGIGRGHYDRLPVLVNPLTKDGGDGVVTEVEVYFAHEGYAEEMWVKCGKGSIHEYLSIHVDKYIWGEVRDVNLTLADYAHIFLKQIGLESISANLTDDKSTDTEEKVDLPLVSVINKDIEDKVNLKMISADMTDDKVDLPPPISLTNKVIEDKVNLKLISGYVTDNVIGDSADVKSMSVNVSDKVIEEKVDLKRMSLTDKVIEDTVDVGSISVNATNNVIEGKVDLKPIPETNKVNEE